MSFELDECINPALIQIKPETSENKHLTLARQNSKVNLHFGFCFPILWQTTHRSAKPVLLESHSVGQVVGGHMKNFLGDSDLAPVSTEMQERLILKAAGAEPSSRSQSLCLGAE